MIKLDWTTGMLRPESDRIYHVYPNSEGHEVDGEACWCEPQIDLVQGVDGKYGAIYLHNQLQ
jgi:hypothetical protein